MSSRIAGRGSHVGRALFALVALTGASALTPALASAQSLFASRGLGIVVAPADARGAALGGLGVSLPGPSSGLLNPADAGDVQRRGIIVAIQPSTTELETAAGSDAVSATRFPLLQLMLPVGRRAVLIAGYGAFLDQNWGITSASTTPLGDDTVTAIDRVTSTGGIAQGRAGVAYNLTDDLTLGAAIGLLTGSTTRTALRTFDEDGIGLSPFRSDTKTTFSAPLAAVGARYRIGSSVLAGLGVTWIGDMTATRSADADEATETESEIAMPLQLAAGISAELLDEVLVAASARWSGWSGTEVEGTTADDILELGGGIEWSGITSGSRRSFPVRLGARWGGQPFAFGDDAPSEQAISLGLGARFAGREEIPSALVDFAIERGSRGDIADNGIGEMFWRATVSVSLFSQ